MFSPLVHHSSISSSFPCFSCLWNAGILCLVFQPLLPEPHHEISPAPVWLSPSTGKSSDVCRYSSCFRAGNCSLLNDYSWFLLDAETCSRSQEGRNHLSRFSQHSGSEQQQIWPDDHQVSSPECTSFWQPLLILPGERRPCNWFVIRRYTIHIPHTNICLEFIICDFTVISDLVSHFQKCITCMYVSQDWFQLWYQCIIGRYVHKTYQ